MKLEINHLAPYLPYNIKVIFNNSIIGILAGINSYKLLFDLTVCESYDNKTPVYKDWCSDDTKLVLRPLSDLTKEIEVNGERFVPIAHLAKISCRFLSGTKIDVQEYLDESGCWCNLYDIENDSVIWNLEFLGGSFYLNNTKIQMFNQLQLFEKLYEWHFDVYDLLEKNLAININSLSK